MTGTGALRTYDVVRTMGKENQEGYTYLDLCHIRTAWHRSRDSSSYEGYSFIICVCAEDSRLLIVNIILVKCINPT